MTFHYINRLVPFSGTIREASSCSRLKQRQRPAAKYYVESERPWNKKFSKGYFNQNLLLSTWNLAEKQEKKC